MTNETEERISQLEDKVSKIEASYWQLLDKLEQRVDQSEAVVAQIVPTLLELAGMQQAIIAFIASNDPEQAEQLQKAIKETQTEYLKTLSQMTSTS